ncbi:uncharacterized protein LOC107398397 [Tribolium castaneum]|uniref:Uncharacterized protein n=1 Tax=Tribolium castaneum TaxID=7070 RepID=A0A139WDS7_TRICA|nr:hypothetical protein TcasGA2_TC033949 [Tribolium castaneum]
MRWNLILLIFGVCIFAINANDETYKKQGSSLKLNIDLLASFSLLAGLLLRGKTKGDLNFGEEEKKMSELVQPGIRDHAFRARLLDDKKLDINHLKKVMEKWSKDDINTVAKLIEKFFTGLQQVVDKVSRDQLNSH